MILMHQQRSYEISIGARNALEISYKKMFFMWVKSVLSRMHLHYHYCAILLTFATKFWQLPFVITNFCGSNCFLTIVGSYCPKIYLLQLIISMWVIYLMTTFVKNQKIADISIIYQAIWNFVVFSKKRKIQ